MTRYRYRYTRPQKTDHNYPDPDHSLFESEGVTITETPFGNDKTYVCYCESDETKINGILNSQSELNRQKFNSIEKCMDWCNENIEHEEGQEFTNDGDVIIDNRIYPELI